MWPLGHAAVAYLCYTGLCRVRSEVPLVDLAAVAVLIGSQVPDLVDKPLSWYLGVLPTGRSLAHSLLVVGPLVGLVYLIAARSQHPEYGVAFGIGAVSHVLVDALPALWDGTDPSFLLWPLLAVEPYESAPSTVWQLFVSSLGDPYFVSQFGLAAIAIMMWYHDGTPGVDRIRQAGRRFAD
jgi:membrane-bound metal-dependent hydrolase YbcI (DUF457 family)